MTKMPYYNGEKGKVVGIVKRVSNKEHPTTHRTMVVTLIPGDMIELRESGRKFRVQEPIGVIYDWMLKRRAEQVRREKMLQRKLKREQRR